MYCLHELAFGIGVVDDPAARLHMNLAVLEDGGAQRDAGIHVATRAEIPDAAGIDAARMRFELGDDFHRANFWCARCCASRKARGEGGDHVLALL